MHYNSLNEITEYLNSNGFFYTKNGAVLKPHIKTGETLTDIKQLLPVQELRLQEIITQNTINPLILTEDIKLRRLATNIDYKTINNYNTTEKQNSNIQETHKQLKNCKYIYIKDTGKYYQIQNSKVRKSGIFTISKELIPEKENIKAFDNYNTVMKAYHYKKATNRYNEDYQKECDKFDSLGVCQW